VDILKQKGLLKKRIYLKIDCEGCEYPVLKVFPLEYLDYVDQFSGEFHFAEIYREEWGMLDILRSIMSKFVPVNLHMNNWACTNGTRVLKSKALEYHLVNKNLITLKSEVRSYWNNPLNVKNGPGVPDCQMQDNETTSVPPAPVVPTPTPPSPPVQEKPKEPQTPNGPFSITVPLAEGVHEPRDSHKHLNLTFDYPTLGMPEPGKRYNATPVAAKDLPIFDAEINELFKPYNVALPSLRTPTASLRATETRLRPTAVT
jgi:hypothetical protein